VLVIIDPQIDFCPGGRRAAGGGRRAAPNGDEIMGGRAGLARRPHRPRPLL